MGAAILRVAKRSGVGGRLAGGVKAGDRELLVRMQDDYWETVGQHFGLERGESRRGRAPRKHVPVNGEQAARIRNSRTRWPGSRTGSRRPGRPAARSAAGRVQHRSRPQRSIDVITPIGPARAIVRSEGILP